MAKVWERSAYATENASDGRHRSTHESPTISVSGSSLGAEGGSTIARLLGIAERHSIGKAQIASDLFAQSFPHC